jgi:RNA polymerase sigma factor (TIGR02999 family)
MRLAGMNETTRILHAIGQGDRQAAEELLPLVYDELRKLAAQRLASEAPGQTLQATALVHEAWMRLTGGESPVSFENRGHFFAAAAEAIRRILIERARKRSALKRGANARALDLERANVAMETDDETLMVVDDALQKLEREQASAAELVKLRFFAGMTNAEACLVLKISERTAKRYWTFARAWLYHEIRTQQAS